MNLLKIFKRFPDQEACIEHLESIRFGNTPYCPHCGSVNVARKADGDRVGRWNCHGCKSSFNVLSGTIFEKTRVPLQKWFLAIGLMVNAKKSVSSPQLARDLDLTRQTALYVQKRIRAQMVADQGDLLQGIVEADETYVGGKPRKFNNKDLTPPPKNPRGRGTDKTPIIGAVERGGRVVARVATDLTGKGILNFIKKTVEPHGSLLITDEYKAYRAVRRLLNHAVINHGRQYADGEVHTNTIEGFWSLLKRAWYGTHHGYTEANTPLFVAEACWKYNNRKNDNAFGTFVRGCFA
jgi:transposase-like protein